MGTRHGVVDPEGQGVDAIIDDLIARTPQVIAAVRAQLPHDFPQALADTVFSGLQQAAEKLNAAVTVAAPPITPGA